MNDLEARTGQNQAIYVSYFIAEITFCDTSRMYNVV